MFGSAILDVAIGMIFIYLLVGLIITATTEVIASLRKWRSDNLWIGIQNLLNPPPIAGAPAPAPQNMAEQLYNHSLIRGLFPLGESGFWVSLLKKIKLIPASKGPSYIPSRTFAIVLLDIIEKANGYIRQVKKDLQNIVDGLPDTGNAVTMVTAEIQKLINLAATISHPSTKSVATDLQNIIDKLNAAGAATNNEAIKKELQSLIDRIPDRYIEDLLSGLNAGLAESLRTLFEEADRNVEKLKENIEIWFNTSMDRVSGWYKRKTQAANTILGFIVAFGLNVDSIQIARSLSNDSALRESIVAAAQQVIKQPPVSVTVNQPANSNASPATTSPGGGAPRNQNANTSPSALSRPHSRQASATALLATGLARDRSEDRNTASAPAADLHLAQDNPPAAANPAVETQQAGGQPDPAADLKKYVAELETLGIPIGWKSQYVPTGTGWITKIFGLLLTALAGSLGAPFWFDMLKRVMTIRSAGKAPEEAPRPPKEEPKPLGPGETPQEQRRTEAKQ